MVPCINAHMRSIDAFEGHQILCNSQEKKGCSQDGGLRII